jgi:REP element-mobilizing transposase RayT
MVNAYSQIYFHVISAVKGRTNVISTSWKDELYKYVTGTVTNKGQKLMIISGMPNCNLSDLVRDIKSNSSKWINEKRFVKRNFTWQVGFRAFSIG